MVSQEAVKRTSDCFKQFRLLVAREIIRNGRNIVRVNADIQRDHYFCELLDEYAIRLLVEWLITRYGSSVYASDVEADENPLVKELVQLLEKAQLYPFLNTRCHTDARSIRNAANQLLDEGLQPSTELIGALYEQTVNRPLVVAHDGAIDVAPDIPLQDKRRIVGQFYTPPHIVQRCYDSVLRQDSNKFMSPIQAWFAPSSGESFAEKETTGDRLPLVLDPACGTGNFLVGAVKLFAGSRRKCGDLRNFIAQSLFGIELDGKAVQMTRVSLLLEYIAQSATPCDRELLSHLLDSLHRHVIIGDAMLLAAGAQESCDVNGNWAGRLSSFDLVITNPPYVSYGSRNQPDILPSQAQFLRRVFPEGAEYKIRLHSIFQDIALRYCRPGGRAVLLVPDGFLTGSFYGRLRQLLLRKASIAQLTELRDDTIPGAVVGRWCIADYRRKIREDECCDYTVRLLTECESAQPVEHHASIAAVVSPHKFRFRLFFDSKDEMIFTGLDVLERLKTRLCGHTGMRSKIGQGRIVSDRRESERWQRGIKSGAQVVPYRVSWDGAWLHVEPSLLFSGGFDSAIIERPKILVRQTGDRLVAAIDKTGLFHLNNVHSFSAERLRAKTPALEQIDLNLACALLNSSLWLYLYQMGTRERSRPLAQIDIETVEHMPLPPASPDIERCICALSAALAGAEPGGEAQLLRAVDRLVYDLYELPAPCLEHIEEYCRAANAKSSVQNLPLPGFEEAKRCASMVCGAFDLG